ncbi:MAG: peptide ABC transporter substrate-binding protein [Solobacterium sp.]|nr:peptide ABC transporter substrate-binding protein [Solobacterium sp.]
MKKLPAALLSATLALTLFGCSNGGASQTEAPKEEETAEATEEPEAYMSDVTAASIKLADTENLVEYTSYQIQQLDYLVTALAEDHEYNANFVDGLLENDRFGTLVPCLAESWEHNEDSSVWTFHLRPGVKWVTSTGEEYDEVKADDFVAGLRHGAEFASGTGWLMEGVIKYYTEYENSDFSDEEFEKVGIKALDDYTVEYTLEGPTPYFDSMTTYAVLYPVNRTFLEAQGEGCKLGSPDESACSFGTTAADSILYNGGFILESYDQDSQITMVKNENYWDAEHVYLKSVKRIYDDGSDPYSGIRSFEQGIYVAAPISAQWENFDQYMEKYNGYTTESLPNPTVFGVVFNMNREKFDLTNYADDEELRANTRAALLNDNFRKALRAAFDRSIYLQVGAPKLLADATLRNINNDPQVVRTSDGRTYGELVTAAYAEMTGEAVDLSDGQDPWLSKDAALDYIAKAEEEGVVFPIHLDMLVQETSKRLVDQAQSMKKSVEDNTDGKIIIELVMADNDTIRNVAYYNTLHEESDYDISTFTGWSPDYADPKSFVDIYSPVSGYYMCSMGLTDANSEDYGDDDEIKETIGLNEYERLYREADAITDDMDARYEAFAKADAYLISRAFFLPGQQQTRSVRVTHAVPFTRVYSTTGMTEYKYKGLQLQEDIVTAADYQAAYDAWLQGE